MNNGIITTIKKELRSVFRDKKTLRNIFVIPLITYSVARSAKHKDVTLTFVVIFFCFQ
jgi:hypothetical protein